jgi:hypothetical protein
VQHTLFALVHCGEVARDGFRFSLPAPAQPRPEQDRQCGHALPGNDGDTNPEEEA